MKVLLVFDLPEEKDDLMYALKGIDYSIVLNELDNWLRNESKHVDHTKEEYEIIDKTRDKLHELSSDHNLPE